MKKKEQRILLWGLMALVMALVVSCTKSNLSNRSSVRFTIGLASDGTRTLYSGEGTVTDGKLVKERIDWVVNDQVRVYSPEAMQTDWAHYAEYKVTSHTHTPHGALMDHAEVAAMDADGKGLTWEAGTTNHFYGMYPSPAIFRSDDPGASWIALDGSTMKGTIAADQTGLLSWTGVTGTGDITGAPDMKYAWMFAKQTGNKGDSEVNLVFYPKFTAFEFTIGSGENAVVHLSSFTLETTQTANSDYPYPYLAGNFSLAGDTELVSVSNTGPSKTITVTFPEGTAVTRATATADAKNLTFTVFALPVDITSLKITFTGEEIGTRTLVLKDGTDSTASPLEFTACKKYRIYGLSFPNFLVAQGEDILWDLEAHGEALKWY